MKVTSLNQSPKGISDLSDAKLRERDRKKDKHVTDEHKSEDEVSNLLGCFPAVEKEICEKEERLLG